MAARNHPLHNLTEDEIARASSILKKHIQQKEASTGTKTDIWFKNVSLSEPPKAILLPYLDAEAAGAPASQRPFVPRCLEIIWSSENTKHVFVSIVSLDSNTVVEQVEKDHAHGPNDRFEIRQASTAILEDEKVKEAVKKLGLPDETVIQADAWMYGADKFSTSETPKMLQSLLYARAPHGHPESNQYAFPLPLSAVYDFTQQRVVRVDPLASGGREDGLAYHTGASKPVEHCEENEYYHELLPEPRKDLKPLQVVQPEGPSFTVTDGNCVSWQKWRFRVGFNYREGLTIHDVRYDNRPVFYRLSVSEMTVPYGGLSGLPCSSAHSANNKQ